MVAERQDIVAKNCISILHLKSPLLALPALMTNQEWLTDLSKSRLTSVGQARSIITPIHTEGALFKVTLTCPGSADSSAAVLEVLLQEFAGYSAATATGPGKHIKVRALGDRTSAGAPPNELVIEFTTTQPAVAEHLPAVAALFEPFVQYHIKTTKSDVHRRMRQQLVQLSKDLLATKQPTLAETG